MGGASEGERVLGPPASPFRRSFKHLVSRRQSTSTCSNPSGAGMRRAVAIISLLIVLSGAGGLLFAWSGIYNVAASEDHWPITRWFLAFGMRHSVELRSRGIVAPPLDHASLFHRGLGHYAGACAPCHGAPGEPQNPTALAMLPKPPYLPREGRDWSAAELFWIVKHGLKIYRHAGLDRAAAR
jgi:hypothetical protein